MGEERAARSESDNPSKEGTGASSAKLICGGLLTFKGFVGMGRVRTIHVHGNATITMNYNHEPRHVLSAPLRMIIKIYSILQGSKYNN